MATQAIMRGNPRVLPPSALQSLADNAKRAFGLRAPVGIPWAPTWHMYLHMCHRAREMGNPQFYSTVLDESYNGRLALLARACHKMAWHGRVLNSFRIAFTLPKRRRQSWPNCVSLRRPCCKCTLEHVCR